MCWKNVVPSHTSVEVLGINLLIRAPRRPWHWVRVSLFLTLLAACLLRALLNRKRTRTKQLVRFVKDCMGAKTHLKIKYPSWLRRFPVSVKRFGYRADWSWNFGSFAVRASPWHSNVQLCIIYRYLLVCKVKISIIHSFSTYSSLSLQVKLKSCEFLSR